MSRKSAKKNHRESISRTVVPTKQQAQTSHSDTKMKVLIATLLVTLLSAASAFVAPSSKAQQCSALFMSDAAPAAENNQKLYGDSLELPSSYVRCGRCQTIYAMKPEDLGNGRGLYVHTIPSWIKVFAFLFGSCLISFLFNFYLLLFYQSVGMLCLQAFMVSISGSHNGSTRWL